MLSFTTLSPFLISYFLSLSTLFFSIYSKKVHDFIENINEQGNFTVMKTFSTLILTLIKCFYDCFIFSIEKNSDIFWLLLKCEDK